MTWIHKPLVSILTLGLLGAAGSAWALPDANGSAAEELARDLISAQRVLDGCRQLPEDHPYGCRRLASAFPENQGKATDVASTNLIKACSQFPPGHAYSCGQLLTYAKCPHGAILPRDCRHQFVQTVPSAPRTEERVEKPALPALADLSSVRDLLKRGDLPIKD